MRQLSEITIVNGYPFSATSVGLVDDIEAWEPNNLGVSVQDDGSGTIWVHGYVRTGDAVTTEALTTAIQTAVDTNTVNAAWGQPAIYYTRAGDPAGVTLPLVITQGYHDASA